MVESKLKLSVAEFWKEFDNTVKNGKHKEMSLKELEAHIESIRGSVKTKTTEEEYERARTEAFEELYGELCDKNSK